MSLHINRALCGAAFVAVVMARNVAAGVIEYEFSGVIDTVGGTGSGLAAGDQFSGFVSYNPSTTLLEVLPSFALGNTGVLQFTVDFFAEGSGTLISSWDFGAMDGAGFDNFVVLNDAAIGPNFVDRFTITDVDTIGNTHSIGYSWTLRDEHASSPGGPLDDISIPLSLNLSEWDEATFVFAFNDFSNANDWFITGVIDELQTAGAMVPLPAPVYLGSLGLLAVIVLRRKIL